MKPIVLIALTAVLLSGCGGQLIKQGPPTYVSEIIDVPITSDQVRYYIVSAGGQTHAKWEMKEIKPGILQARVNYRGKHKIVMDIHYSKDSYRFVYVSSEMMRYVPASQTGGLPHIGRYYLDWTETLDKTIKANLRDYAKRKAEEASE